MISTDDNVKNPQQERQNTAQKAFRNCNSCLRKAVCILYYTELDLRFAKESAQNSDSKGLIGIINHLDSELACTCRFYLEENVS